MQDPGAIRVWPGTIVKTEDRKSLTITLSQMYGETWEDFIARVNAICNYAVSCIPKKKPEVFDFSDTSKYRQVGPNAYEAITPGDEQEE